MAELCARFQLSYISFCSGNIFPGNTRTDLSFPLCITLTVLLILLLKVHCVFRSLATGRFLAYRINFFYLFFFYPGPFIFCCWVYTISFIPVPFFLYLTSSAFMMAHNLVSDFFWQQQRWNTVLKQSLRDCFRNLPCTVHFPPILNTTVVSSSPCLETLWLNV